MSSQGHFYTVASKNSKSESLVYSLKQLLSTFSLPLDVRLVSGPLPNKPPNFTGMFSIDPLNRILRLEYGNGFVQQRVRDSHEIEVK